ncbi:sulfatase [bacterium]|nr:sulfatase [bacterium]
MIRKLFVIVLICIFSFLGCRKEEKRTGPPLIRLHELLEDPSTEIKSDVPITSSGFQDFQGEGWTTGTNFISASDRRAIFLFPEAQRKIQGFRLKFQARSAVDRNLKITVQNKQIAVFRLTPEWKQYQLRFSSRDLSKPTVKQLIFQFDGADPAAASPYADFRDLQTSSYLWGRSTLFKDTRSSLAIRAASNVIFQVTLPAQKPRLFFGIGVPSRKKETPQQTQFVYSVIIHTKWGSNELLRRTMHSSPKDAKWKDESVDLSDFAGKQVRLELKSESSSSNLDSYIAWSSPEIYDVASMTNKPNIILISIDTLRADRVFSGFAPNLAAFAKQSIVYRNAYCTFPSTLSSHTSVMTGLYVASHQVSRPTYQIVRTKLIPRELNTIAEVAHQAGYYTAGITDGGFVSGFYGFEQGFQEYLENPEKSHNRVATLDNAQQWIGTNSNRPFFLFLHSYTVHEPFHPPADVFRKLFPKPALDQPPHITMEWLDKVVGGKLIPTEQQKEFVRQCYNAEVYFYDQNFGLLMRKLKQLGLDKNTVILIFGDHGEMFFDRDNTFGHGKTLHKEEISVPLILSLPGKKQEERTDLVSLVDIYPTLAALMGAEIRNPIDGISLLEPPGSAKRSRRTIYYELTYGNEAKWGIQSNEFKMVFDKQKGQQSFYDLRKDPEEKNDLSATAPRTMQSMKALLSAYIQKSVTPTELVKGAQDKKESDELREQLKALGYIN